MVKTKKVIVIVLLDEMLLSIPWKLKYKKAQLPKYN